MNKTYTKPEAETIYFNDSDIISTSGCNHENHGHHYGWDDPQPEHGHDNEHGHNHGGNGHH